MANLHVSYHNAIPLSLSRFNHRLTAYERHPNMIKGAAACHLRSPHDLKGWDKVLHLIHGYMSDLQERERDCTARARATSYCGGRRASEAS